MSQQSSSKGTALKNAYDKFKARIASARKKTKDLLNSVEERKRESRMAELRRNITRAN